MVLDLKVSVKRQIDKLQKELAAATTRVAGLRDEIKRHELILDMLDGSSKAPRREAPSRGPRAGGSKTATQRRGPRGAMIDWNAVFDNLPGEFTLDTIGANKTAGEKPRAYLRQVVVRWSKEGRIKRTGRGMYRKA